MQKPWYAGTSGGNGNFNADEKWYKGVSANLSTHAVNGHVQPSNLDGYSNLADRNKPLATAYSNIGGMSAATDPAHSTMSFQGTKKLGKKGETRHVFHAHHTTAIPGTGVIGGDLPIHGTVTDSTVIATTVGPTNGLPNIVTVYPEQWEEMHLDLDTVGFRFQSQFSQTTKTGAALYSGQGNEFHVHGEGLQFDADGYLSAKTDWENVHLDFDAGK